MRKRSLKPAVDGLEPRYTLDGSDAPPIQMGDPGPGPAPNFPDGMTFSPDPAPVDPQGIDGIDYILLNVAPDGSNYQDQNDTAAIPGPGPISPF